MRTLPRAASMHLVGLAVLSLSVASATAQSQMLTTGQFLAKNGDTPIGLPAGVSFDTATPFDFPVMSREGNCLFRGHLGGFSVTTLDDRALFIGRTGPDLAVLLRAGDVDPSGTFPNSQVLQVSTTTGLPVGTNLFSTPRISPLGNKVLFHAQLYDGGNPGLDGLVHTTGVGTINDGVLYTGTPGALQVLAQQAVTTMPGGAALNFASINITQTGTSLNSAGTVTFKSSLVGGDVVGSTNSSAWVIGTPGNLSYLLRAGDPVLGSTTVVVGTGTNCVLNEAGDVLHDETLSTTLGTMPATLADDKIAFITLAGSGVHSTLVREGDPAVDPTGAPIPGVFYGAQTLCSGFGPSATAAFHNTMTGAVTAGVDDRAIFAGGLGSLKMIARAGDVVPGTGGEKINVPTLSGTYSENFGVAFGCTLAASAGVNVNNDSCLLLAAPGGGLTLIAREGAACPDLPGYVFGIPTGTYNFGGSTSHRMNDRGQVMFFILANNGGPNVLVLYSWDPVHGLQLQLKAGDVVGADTVTNLNVPLGQPSGDGNSLAFSETGDFCIRPVFATGQWIARGHIGSLQGLPSAVPVTGGVPQFFSVDAGPTQAFKFYVILATSLGTEPGFTSPLGPQNIPLNFDILWTQLSLDAANSAIWINTLGITDASGKGIGAAGFVMPAGYPGFLGTTLHHAAVLLDFTLTQTFVTEPVPCYLY